VALDEIGDAGLAIYFYDQGNYKAAVREFLRLHYYDRHEESPEWLAHIGDSFYQLDRQKEATKYFRKYLRHNKVEKDDRVKVYYKLVKSLIADNIQEGLIELYQAPNEIVNYDRDRYYYYLTLIGYKLQDLNLAQESIAELSYNSFLPDEAVAELNKRIEKNNRKNHFHARLLSSILPGLGQAVNGNPSDGLNSLLIIGSFSALFVHVTNLLSFQDAAITIVPWLGKYYVGGLKNASEQSERKQKKLAKEYISEANDILRTAKLSSEYN